MTIGTAGVQNYATVVVLRFLVGTFEAGFFPGIVYLITICESFALLLFPGLKLTQAARVST